MNLFVQINKQYFAGYQPASSGKSKVCKNFKGIYK